MDLSHGYFYKTIEEADTAIKEYFKEHYFVINRCSSKNSLETILNEYKFFYLSGTIPAQSNCLYSSGTISDEQK